MKLLKYKHPENLRERDIQTIHEHLKIRGYLASNEDIRKAWQVYCSRCFNVGWRMPTYDNMLQFVLNIDQFFHVTEA